MMERLMAPSEVFAYRLKELRAARGLSQTMLALMVTESGTPLNKAALLRIEKGERGLSLDEALAIAAVLETTPAYMLTPPGDAWVEVTKNHRTDSSGIRYFL